MGITSEMILHPEELDLFLKRIRYEKVESIYALEANASGKARLIRNVMDYYLFTIITLTGMNISEALRLKCEDIRGEHLSIRGRRGAKSVEKVIVFSARVSGMFEELQAFKKQYVPNSSDECFAVGKEPSSRSYAHTRFKYWLAQAGLSTTYSINSLRHTYIARSLEEGYSSKHIRESIGKSKLRGLRTYQRIIERRKAEK